MAINVTIRSAEQVGGQVESEIDVFGTGDDRGRDYILAVAYLPRSLNVFSTSATLTGERRGQVLDTYNVTGPAQTRLGDPIEEVRARVFEPGLLGSRGDLLDEDTVTIDRGAPGPGTGGGEPSVPGGSDPGSGGTETPDLSDVTVTCQDITPRNPEPGGRIEVDMVVGYGGTVTDEPLVTYQVLIGGVTAGTVELNTSSVQTSTIAASVPAQFTPGDTVDVEVQAIDIRR
jgi:hypothetical protein